MLKLALGEEKHQTTTAAVHYPQRFSPNPPGTCQPVGEGAHTSTKQQSQGSGMIQRHHLCGYFIPPFWGIISLAAFPGSCRGRMRAGIAMTKPRAWRGCLNQMLIPYLLQEAAPAAVARCQRGPPGCWHGVGVRGPGKEEALAQCHPLQHPALAGGQGPALPPSARQGALRRRQE